MRLSSIFLAALPVLAAAESPVSSVASSHGPVSTTTCTDTAKLTKTMTLSRVHTVTSIAHNTTSWMPTGSMSKTSVMHPPTTLPTDTPENGGAALDAGKLAFAGVAGMIVVALL